MAGKAIESGQGQATVIQQGGFERQVLCWPIFKVTLFLKRRGLTSVDTCYVTGMYMCYLPEPLQQSSEVAITIPALQMRELQLREPELPRITQLQSDGPGIKHRMCPQSPYASQPK